MIGPSGRDLYKTYPNLQRLGAKKKKSHQQTQIAISMLDLQWRDAISGVEDCVASGCSPCQAQERVRSGWSVNVISTVRVCKMFYQNFKRKIFYFLLF